VNNLKKEKRENNYSSLFSGSRISQIRGGRRGEQGWEGSSWCIFSSMIFRPSFPCESRQLIGKKSP
jgi:hypothetical protein